MIPLSEVDIGPREHAYATSALDDRWISGTGPFIGRFEAELARRVSTAHAVAVANGTLAIELALRALDIGPGDQVIVPALTFAAPAMSVVAVGAEPVLADVTEDSWTLSPADVDKKVGPPTKAIIAVDVLGHPADYDELRRFGVPIIQDAAEAHGSHYKGRPAGSAGDIGAFSFHANKTITTGEGGAVCTSSEPLAARMRTMANHGMKPERPYHHEELGRNFRMTNIIAAIGVGQLERWDELVAARRRIAARYDEGLRGSPYGRQPVAEWADASAWLYVVTTPERDRVVQHLRADGIDARGIWPALSRTPALRRWHVECPVTEHIADRAILLPTSSRLSDTDGDHIVRSLLAAAAE